ncbi:cysteine dioxygenase family protein [Nocardioides sp. CER19]|uniref:cysteine dioxygenase n=1 Tax=Nocardioides sp. CER19 TaxID=3038538 RepID=UPI00244CF4B7|nr:cysteine dioxygenase family protein [Nocardioides sp. CER19]MDH2413575.1 cysteine dioxygenase family protein [Nocardioides sp. CER19]
MPALTVLPLLEALRDHADDPDLHGLLDPPAEGRTFYLLTRTDDLELWLIAWAPGASTGYHDHGTATGAHTVLEGALVEHSFDGGLQLVDATPGDARAYAAGRVHDMRNPGSEPALSLHAYSPRLDAMNHYRFLGDRMALIGAEPGRSPR